METVKESENEYDEKISEYRNLISNEDKCRWKKGDLALDVEIKYGQKTLQKFAEDVGEEYNTLRIYRKVAGTFRSDKRSSKVSWTHHFIASMTENPEQWLEKVENEGLSTRQLKSKIKQEKEPITDTSRNVTSISLNKRVFEDFKGLCKEKNLVISYVLEDLMKQALQKYREEENINWKLD